MAASTHTHEELATKKDVDARFDRLEERMDRVETAITQINSSIASILNVLASHNERFIRLEENQRVMIQMLERIENSTSRQIGF